MGPFKLILLALILVVCEQINADIACPKPKISTSKCNKNGIKHANITSYSVIDNKCKPETSQMIMHCRKRKEKNDFCKCSIVGDPHFRTFDGQSINFYGSCNYALASTIGTNHSNGLCSFESFVIQETRGANTQFTYIRSINIKINGTLYRLGKNHSLNVNDEAKTLPYQTKNTRIFKSGMMIQYVNKQCGIRIAFDGDTNGFIEISKKYGGIVKGICGDCNGVKDDFKINGTDLTSDPDRDAKIGNFYATNKCKPAITVKVDNVCSKSTLELIKSNTFCGILLNKNAFSGCGSSGSIDLKEVYEDCLVDLCGASLRNKGPKSLQDAFCELLSGVNEQCAEQGWSGIRWRSEFKCPLTCGSNQHFSSKARPCPKTCENHFYGTKSPCYDLPEREDCVCDEGYILDGALCVKPDNCKCIELCADQKPRAECLKWKNKGRCSSYKEEMNKFCSKTCGFCKSKADDCEDELSSSKCNEFMVQGKCKQPFYKSICGLTCNFEKCRCKEDKTTKTECDELTKSRLITYIRYGRNAKGQCMKKTSQRSEVCECDFKETTETLKCNYCTSKQAQITTTRQEKDGKCVTKNVTTHTPCGKCERNEKTHTSCSIDIYKHTTTKYNELKSCFECKQRINTSIKAIKCLSDRNVGKCDKKTCLRKVIDINSRPVNCKCQNDTNEREEVCCCTKKEEVTKEKCIDGRFVSTKTTYKFDDKLKECIPTSKEIIRVPKCKKPKETKGKCQKTLNGKFHCKATDLAISYSINDKCECVRRTDKTQTTCCCPEDSTSTKCNKITGMKTEKTVRYTLVSISESDSVCEQYESSKTEGVPDFENDDIKTLECDKSTCKQTIMHKVHGRIGCTRGIVRRFNETKQCCCRDESRQNVKCILNKFVLRTNLKLMLNSENKCVWKEISSNETTVTCPENRVEYGPCILPNNQQLETRYSYVLEKCKCKEKKNKVVQDCPCKANEVKKKFGTCDKSSCIQTVTETRTDSLCETSEVKSTRLCCCTQKSSTNELCDKQNGLKYQESVKWKLNQLKNECEKQSNKVYIPKTCKQPQEKNSTCGQFRPHMQKFQTISYHINLDTCECVKKTDYRFKVCDCNKKEYLTTICYKTYFKIYYMKYYTDYNLNMCIKTKVSDTIPVKCPELLKTKEKRLDKCRLQITTYERVYKKCSCTIKKKTIILHECCTEKPQKVHKCIDNKVSRFTTTEYRPSIDKLKCKPNEIKQEIQIFCNRNFEQKETPCKNYFKTITTKYYDVKDCKCQVVKTDNKKVRCGCKKIPVKKNCLAAKKQMEIVTTNVFLTDGICKKDTNRNYKPIICQNPVDKMGKCNGKVGKTPIKVTYWIVDPVSCVCKQKMKTRYINCPCTKERPKLEAKKCDIAKNKRLITKKMFLRVNGTCEWTETDRLYEDCECKPIRQLTKCINHQKKIEYDYGEVEYYSAKNGIDFMKCMKVDDVTSTKEIKCAEPKKWIAKKCENYRKKVYLTKYTPRNCTCQKSEEVIETKACNCEDKNTCRFVCHNKGTVKKHQCDVYEAKGSICAMTVKERVVPIDIPSRPKKTCGECELIKSLNGYFKKCEEVQWSFSNCKYNRQVLRTKEFCKCKDDYSEKKQCDGTAESQKQVSFTFNESLKRCERKEDINTKQIECRKPTITVKSFGCIRFTYLYYSQIVNCKCNRVSKNHAVTCCNKPVTNKVCRANSWVKRTVSYTLTKMDDYAYPNYKLGDLYKCVRKSEEETEFISCAKSFKTYKCQTASNKLMETKFYNVIERCMCIPKKKITWLPSCKKCPETKFNESPCRLQEDGNKYKTVTKVYYKVQADNTCKKMKDTFEAVCECRDSRNVELCRFGSKIFQKYTYPMDTDPPCQEKLKETKVPVPCYNNGDLQTPWTVVHTDKCVKPYEYTYEILQSDMFKNCRCEKKTSKKKISICCKECEQKISCPDNPRQQIDNICYKSEGLKCVKDTKTSFKDIVCESPVESEVGKCNLITGEQKFRVSTFEAVNCACTKNDTIITKRCKCFPKETKECRGYQFKITKTEFTLDNGKCIPDVRTRNEPVDCMDMPMYMSNDTKIDDCKFERNIYKLKVKDCKCEYEFNQKKILFSKCCQEIKQTETCNNDREKVFETTYYELNDNQCDKKVKRERKPVKCPSLKSPVKVHLTDCIYKKVWYKNVIKSCSCKSKVSRQEEYERCCFHRLDSKSTHCDKLAGNIVTIMSTWQSRDGVKCIQSNKTTTVPVECSLKKCQNVTNDCINNNRKIIQTCYKREGCKCVPDKKVYNECCDANGFTEEGKCIGKYRGYRYYVYRMQNKRCVRALIRIKNVVCRCPGGISKKICWNHDKYKIYTVNFTLNLETNGCDKNKITEVLNIEGNCKRSPYQVVKKLETKCDKETFRGYTILLVRMAINCTCVTKKQRIDKYPCYCPPPKSDKKCENNTMIERKMTPVCGKDSLEWKTTTVESKIVHCSDVQDKETKCMPDLSNGPAVSFKYVKYFKQYPKECVCTWKLLNKTREDCRCRDDEEHKSCENNKIIIKSVKRIKEGLRCVEHNNTINKPVPCPLKPQISSTKCTAASKTFTKTTTTFSLENCECKKTIKDRTCDCRCPKNSVKEFCSGEFYKTKIETIYTMGKMCRCISNTTRTRIVPKCPKIRPPLKTPCIKSGNIGYLTNIQYTINRDERNCLCQLESSNRTNVCWCKPEPLTNETCTRNAIKLKVTTKVSLDGNECIRVKVNSSETPVECPEKEEKKNCDEKTGVETLKITTYRIKNCLCVKKTETKKYPCKCNGEWKIIKKFKCSKKPLCLRNIMYRKFVLVDRQCKSRFKNDTKVCCCHQNSTTNRYCKFDQEWWSRTTTWKLNKIRNVCEKSTKESKDPLEIQCDTKDLEKSNGKCINGKYTKYTYKRTISNCKCEKVEIDQKVCDCNCNKEVKTKKVCEKVDFNRIKETIITTKYVLKNCKCKLVVDKNTNVKELSCLDESSVTPIDNCTLVPSKSKLEKYQTMKRTWNVLDVETCKCVQRENNFFKFCGCKESEETNTNCKMSSAGFYIEEKEVCKIQRKNNKCEKKCHKDKSYPNCRSSLMRWREIDREECSLNESYNITMSRVVKNKCKCVEEKKYKKCDCKCSGPKKSKLECANDSYFRYYKYTYKWDFEKCRCLRTQCEQMKQVTCKKKPSKEISPCVLIPEAGQYFKKVVEYSSTGVGAGCKCTYEPNVRAILCPCNPNCNTDEKCNQLTQQYHVTKTCVSWINDTCTSSSVTTYRSNECDTASETCQRISECDVTKNIQKFKCSYRELNSCVCLVKERTKNLPCKCNKDKKFVGKCLKTTCKRKIETTTYINKVLKNGKISCEPETSSTSETCCCTNKKINTKEKCDINKRKLFKIKESWEFDVSSKLCNREETSEEITPECSPKREVLRGKTCDKSTCLRTDLVTTKKINAECKCDVSTEKIMKKCCCLQKPKTTKKCHPTGLFFTVEEKLYKFNKCAGTCEENISKSTELITCPQPLTDKTAKCDGKIGMKAGLKIYYDIVGCVCVKKTEKVNIPCPCDPSEKVEETCDADRGVKVIKTTLRKGNEGCEEESQKSEEPISCSSDKPKTYLACEFEKFGDLISVYKLEKTTITRREACECKDQIVEKYIVCDCRKSHTKDGCRDNNILFTILINYVKQLSQDNSEKYVGRCVKTEKVISEKVLKSKPPKVKTLECDRNSGMRNYLVKTWKIKECRYFSQTKTIPVLCYCKKKVSPVKKCLSDNMLRTTTTVMKLKCVQKPSGIPRCKCKKVSNSKTEPVVCDRPRISSECVGGWRYIKVTWYKPIQCKCKAFKYAIKKSCDEGEDDCEKGCCDLAGKKMCQEYKQVKLCKASYLFREVLCGSTCKPDLCKPNKCKSKKPLIEKLSDCECKTIGAFNKVCSYKVQITRWKLVAKGEVCSEVKTQVRVPCFCIDKRPKEECDRLKVDKKCSTDKQVREDCAATCRPDLCSHCKYSGEEEFKECIQSGAQKGKYFYSLIRYRGLKDTGLCFVEVNNTYRGSCETCDTDKPEITVQNCVYDKENGKYQRSIVLRYVEKNNKTEKCVNKVKITKESCEQCCPSTETTVSKCSGENGKETRKVTTIYWANERGCCRKKTAINTFDCSAECAGDSTVTRVRSKCFPNSQRIVTKTFYSGNSKNGSCDKHTVYYTESCSSSFF